MKYLKLVAAAMLLVVGISMLYPTPGVKVVTKEGVSLLSNKSSFPALIKLTKDGKPFCSGVVISDTEVLTAAHCVSQFTPFGMMVISDFSVESLQKADLITITPVIVEGVNPRQDTAILVGDFRLYKKANIRVLPEEDILVNNYRLASCGFPYSGKEVCYTLSGAEKMIDVIGFSKGQMYAGMSGGPVIDLDTGDVVAVNHAVGENMVLVAPIVNLFEGLTKVQ